MTSTTEFLQTQQLASTLRHMTPDTSNLGSYRKGVIVSVQDGPPATCTITLSGDTTQIPNIQFLDSYIPVVGDTVIIGKQGGSLLVLGTVEPRPPSQAVLYLARATDQAIPTSTNTAISWSSETKVGGPASWWDSGTPAHIVCPWIGLYQVSATCGWQGNTTGRRILHLNKGSTIADANVILGGGIVPTTTDEGSRYSIITNTINVDTVGQIYQWVVWQNSGGDLNITSSFAIPKVSCSFMYLGKP